MFASLCGAPSRDPGGVGRILAVKGKPVMLDNQIFDRYHRRSCLRGRVRKAIAFQFPTGGDASSERTSPSAPAVEPVRIRRRR